MSGCLGYLLLVVAALVAEIASIVVIGGRIGSTWTLIALATSVALGMTILADRGVLTMQAAARAMASHQPVGPVVADGALIALAGVLLVVPGFVSDVIGLALLIPPLRVQVRARLVARFQGAVVVHRPADGAIGEVIDTTGTERADTDDGPAGPELPP